MSLFADICRDSTADDSDISFDPDTKTWTVIRCWTGDDTQIPGIPSKELARAIARALYTAWCEGGNAAGYSYELR